MPLKPDATIADVLPDLGDAETYLCRVLEPLHANRHVGAVVRIGTSGSGAYPCFRICKLSPTGESILAAYNDNGTQFPTAEGVEHWSSKAMTLDEVKTLLGSVRSSKRKLR